MQIKIMQKLWNKLAVVTLTVLTSFSAMAYDESDRAELDAYVTLLNNSIDTQEFEEFMEQHFPPKLMQYMVDKTGLPAEIVNTVMLRIMQSTFGQFTEQGLEADFDFDYDNMAVKQTADGQEYLLLPTMTTIYDKESKTVYQSHGLVVVVDEDSTWYVYSMAGERQKQILQEIHPKVTGVEIPKGTYTEVAYPQVGN